MNEAINYEEEVKRVRPSAKPIQRIYLPIPKEWYISIAQPQTLGEGDNPEEAWESAYNTLKQSGKV